MASSFGRFRALAGRGNVVPVHREILADCLTPVLAYLAAAGGSRRCFLLESVEGGERIARYSFLGWEPYRVLSARGDAIRDETGRRVRRVRGDFLKEMQEIFAGFRPAPEPALPPFTGGAVGWIAYDAARRFEAIEDPDAPARSRRDGPEGLPDAWFGFYDTVVAFDHVRQSILLMTCAMTDRDDRSLRLQYAAAQDRLDRLAAALARRPKRARARAGFAANRDGSRRPAARSNMTRREFGRIVAAAQERIRAGDIYQVVLSQRFRRPLASEPFSVYRALRRINPSPYMYYLRDGATSLAGASPEMLVRVEGRSVELHPIAGTRPRGRNPEEDADLERELLADAKERAEHVMLVDLGRNDLGRVCAAGQVSVPEFMRVERYSHVMHIVSRVTGRLRRGATAFDALRAVFPAGTVSGAPKVRAMQIIGTLERDCRGPYAGAVCYVDYSGDLDSCITIRTMVSRGRTAYVQAGAGIVADSDPDREYRETVSKARAVLAAVEGAGSWVR